MKRFLFFAVSGLFLCSIVKAQVDKRAVETIDKARAVAVKRSSGVKVWLVEYNGEHRSSSERKTKGYVDYKYQRHLWVQDSPRIRLRILATYPDSQQELIERIFSEGAYSETNKVRVDGQGFTEMTFLPDGDPLKIRTEKMSALKFDTFSAIFPILFKLNIGLQFKFAGVANAGEKKANVLETTLDGSHKIKLFLDKETHLLLMMTAVFYDSLLKKQIEQKFFYSDFREENGLLYAHKVIVQENGEVIEERLIKLVTPDPSIKPNHFDVKE